MFSAKSQLEKFIASHLGDYVEEYDTSSLSTLKSQSWDAGEGRSVKLVHGFIGELRIQVPWTQLQSGRVKVSVDKVHIVLKMFTEDSQEYFKARDEMLHQSKMAQLKVEEQKMFGMAAYNPGTWSTQILESLTSSLLSNIVNGFSLSLTDVRVSLLLSLPRAREVCHVRCSFASAVIEQLSVKELGVHHRRGDREGSCVFNKKCHVRGLSIEVSRVSDGDDSKSSSGRQAFSGQRESGSLASASNPGKRNRRSLLSVAKQFYLSLGSPQTANILLMPMNLECNAVVWKVLASSSSGASDTTPDNTEYNMHLQADLKLSGVDLTPHISQLLLFKQAMAQIEADNLRIKYLHLRPTQGPSAANNNILQWWRYAVGAVIIKKKGYVNLPIFKHGANAGSGDVHTRSYYRNRYIYLYDLYIEATLRRYAALQNNRGKTKLSKADEKPALSDNHADELDHLHRIIPYEKLLIYRAIVHQRLQKTGVTVENLKLTLTAGGVILDNKSDFWSYWTGSTPELDDVDNPDEEDTEIMLLMEEVKAQASASKRFSSLMLSSSIIIPKLAISLHSDLNVLIPNSSDVQSSGPVMSYVMYALHGVYEQGSVINDSGVNLCIGAVRVFGVGGVEMLSCGDMMKLQESEYDDGISDIVSVREANAALTLKLGFYVIDDDIIGDDRTDEDAAARAIERITYGAKQHVVVELCIAKFTLLWDQNSVSYLQHQFTEYYQGSQQTLKSNLSDVSDECCEVHVFSNIRKKCSLYAMNKSASFGGAVASTKWSVDLLLLGVCLDFPILTEKASLDVDGLLDLGEQESRHLNLSFEAFHAISGDFLPVNVQSNSSHADKEDALSEVPSRQLWPHVDKILHLKLLKLRSAVIHPISISMTGVTAAVVRLDSSGGSMTQDIVQPWHVKGFISHSLLPCHPIYPDLQIDFYTSPLVISCTAKAALEMFSATCSILHPVVSHTNSVSVDGESNDMTQNSTSKTQQFPRVRNLAPLCVLKVNLNIDEVNYTLLSTEDVPVADELKDVFDTYASHILDRGSFARVSHTSERLAIQRLRKFEIDVRGAELALRSICAAAEVNPEEVTHVIGRLVKQFSAGLPLLMNPAVIAYTFYGIHFSTYSLTYDSRTTFHIEEVLVSDHNSNPVVHLFCDSLGHYDSLSVNSKMKAAQKERGKNSHSSNKKKGAPIARPLIENIAKKLESSSIASHCAFGVTYTEQDANYGWGAGGGSVKCLYGETPPPSKKVGEISISLKNMDTLLSTDGIPIILHATLPLIASLYSQYIRLYCHKHFEIPQKTDIGENGSVVGDISGDINTHKRVTRSKETLNQRHQKPVSRIKYSYQISVDCAHFVLATSSKYLCEFAVKGSRIGLSTSLKGGFRRKNGLLVRASINTLELHDLSPAGSLHPSIIMKDTNVKSDMINMTATVGSKSTVLNATIHGLRVCLLYRFILEVMAFGYDSFSAVLMAEFKSFSDLLSQIDQKVIQQLLEVDNGSDVSSSHESAEEEDSDNDVPIGHDGFFEYPTADVDIRDVPHGLPTLKRPSLFGGEGLVLDRARSIADRTDKYSYSRHNSMDSTLNDFQHHEENKIQHRYEWSITIVNATAVMPRSSASDDLVAAVIKKCVIAERKEITSWGPPANNIMIHDRSEALFFDYESNTWMKTSGFVSPEESGAVRSKTPIKTNTSKPNLSSGRKISNHEPGFATEFKNFPKSAVVDITGATTSLFDDAKSEDSNSTTRVHSKSSGGSDGDFLSVDGDELAEDISTPQCTNTQDDDSEVDDDLFQDAVEMPEFIPRAGNGSGIGLDSRYDDSMVSTPYSISGFPTYVAGSEESSCFDLDSDIESDYEDHTDRKVTRFVIQLDGLDLFCSLAGPLHVEQKPLDHMQVSFRRFVSVQHDSPVYSILQSKRAQSVWSTQRWNSITPTPTNLLAVIDYDGPKLRMLFSETKVPASLHLKVSMAELYLLMSLYFDNMNERPEFIIQTTQHSRSARSSVSSEDSYEDMGVGRESYFPDHPEYGTAAFGEYIRKDVSSTDIIVVRSDLRLDCSMDGRDYFSKDVYSYRYLDYDEQEDASITSGAFKLERLPFASVQLLWMTMYCQVSKDVLQFALGVAEAGVADIRVKRHSTLVGLDVLKIVPRATTGEFGEQTPVFKHGYADFDFGLKEGPTSIRSPIDIPFKVTYFATGNTWGVSNVGCDGPDFDVSNMDIIWLLQDFFSMYFCYEEYGNPSIAAYNLVDRNLFPYGGIDTRIFVTRPHIQTHDDTASTPSQCLIVAADTGVYFRYIYDTDGSVKMEVHVSGLVMVLLKAYRPPLLSRGLRGTAGSGRGVRTVLEYTSLKYSCNFDKKKNVVDYMFSIFPDISDKRKMGQPDSQDPSSMETRPLVHMDNYVSSMEYVDFDTNAFSMQAVRIQTPKAVSPLHIPSREFPKQCCNITSSFEDSLFTVSLIMHFLGIDESKPEDTVAAASTNEESEVDSVDPAPSSGVDDKTTSFVIVRLQSVKVVVVDSVLGLHLPLAQLFISDVYASYHYDPSGKTPGVNSPVEPGPERLNFRDAVDVNAELQQWTSKLPPMQRRSTRNLMAQNSLDLPETGPHSTRAMSLDEGGKYASARFDIEDRKALPIIKAYVEGLLWADYFNSMLKCWEPLVEPFSGALLYEQHTERGKGAVVKITSPLHINVSIAMIRALNDAMRVVNDIDDKRREDRTRVSRNITEEVTQVPMSPRGRVILSDRFGSGDNGEEKFDAFRSARDSLRILKAQPTSVSRRMSMKMDHRDDSALSGIHHLATPPLPKDARVGFSVINLTGYPIRYLQVWESGHRQTVQYLHDGQRGLLNFIASNTLIRDNQIVEEAFSNPLSGSNSTSNTGSKSSSRKGLTVGHKVSLQVAGYQWLDKIQADTLGVRYVDLVPVIGRLNPNSLHSTSQMASNALKLVTEVIPHNGGRLLTLSSTFVIKNDTTHSLKLLTSEVESLNSKAKTENPFLIPPGESFNVPLALLYRSAVNTQREKVTAEPGDFLASDSLQSLGYLRFAPADKQIIVDDLGVSAQMIGDAHYTDTAVNLLRIVKRTIAIMHEAVQRDNYNGITLHDGMFQLSCELTSQSGRKKKETFDTDRNPMNSIHGSSATDELETGTIESTRIINYDKLPAFCYNVEIEATSHHHTTLGGDDIGQVDDGMKKNFFTSGHSHRNEILNSPCTYTIVIHPPIILHNFLPMKGTFELVHATKKSVLWSSTILPGKSKYIHTVTLDIPMLLLINLDFCRSSEGVLVHKPPAKDTEDRGLAETVLEGFKGLLEDNDDPLEETSIILTDSVGQRIRLQIENQVGGGGHRSIVVYCPYWVVNTSQYTLRLREESSPQLPAGTVTAQKDGRMPAFLAAYHHNSGLELVEEVKRRKPRRGSTTDANYSAVNEERVFPGRPGPLHSSRVQEIQMDSPLRSLLKDIKFDTVMEMASLFNFMEPSESQFLGSQKVIAQLDESNWSNSFTLESAGVSQLLQANHSEKGTLELAFKVSSAPGKFMKYTKVIRFSPRFVVFNKLSRSLKIIQINGFLYERVPIEVSAGHLSPFHLPVIFGERRLAVDVDGPWSSSVAFDIDQIGSYSLRLRRRTDTSALNHILTRGNPEYDVTLPPGEIGIWFETDWTNKQIVVMRIRKGSLASTRTDIQAGDVLLRVNGLEVKERTFEEVMMIMKSCLQREGCTLTLRTVEEKMRLIRESALVTAAEEQAANKHSRRTNFPVANRRTNLVSEHDDAEIAIKVEMRAVDSSVFMIISDLDTNVRPEYRVENNSANFTIHYRQKGIADGRWSSLDPGMSATYIWEDPLKQHRLLVRVGRNVLCPTDELLNSLAIVREHPFSFLSVGTHDNLTTTVMFDEIGFVSPLQIPKFDGKLVATVQSEGPTKVLSISPLHPDIQQAELNYSISSSGEQCDGLERLREAIEHMYNAGTKDLEKFESDISALISSTIMLINSKLENVYRSLLAECEFYGIEEHLRNSLVTVAHPFVTLLGPTITKTNMILVEVIEATGLKEAVYLGTDETYCEIQLKTHNSLQTSEFAQLQETYTNDQFIDPYWLDQKFLFNVPVQPLESIRGYYVRVKVKSHSIVGADVFLGQADIQFSSLVKEDELCGWFPLKPKTFSIRASPESLKVSGSIKLRVQWVHSIQGLKKHLGMALSRRVEMLTSHRLNQKRLLRKLNNMSLNMTEAPQSRQRPALDPFMEPPPSQLTTRRGRSLAHGAYVQLKQQRKKASSKDPKERKMDEFTSIGSYLDYYKKVLNDVPRVKHRAETMRRRDELDSECETFRVRMDEETQRNYTNVNSMKGRLEITPIQALNLPQSERPVYVQFKYGDETFKTFSAPATAHPIWHVVEQPSSNKPESGTDSKRMSVNLSGGANGRPVPENLTAVFDINTVSVKGNIGVVIVQEMFAKRNKLCRLSIPVFSLLDCVCSIYPYPYDRWFPLRNSGECRPTDGDMGTSMSAAHAEKLYSNLFEYHPCIRLSIRWIPDNPNAIYRRTSTLYGRLQLPSISLSIIDSSRAREIMQIVISDIEGRHSESTELTESSLIVNWLQVDNQLPDPISPVMLSPTSVPRPLPTIRLHVVKNNALSHEHLDSYDRLDLDVQVLDLHLEQQTVVAVWDFIRTIRNDINVRKQESSKQAASGTRSANPTTEDRHHDDRDDNHSAGADADIDKIYIDHFRISTIMFKISFIMNPQALSSTNSSVAMYHDSSTNAGESPMDEHSSVHQFMWQVGEVVLDLTSTIQDAPIRLRDITVDHLFKTWGEVRSILQDHYLNSALGQMYRIVGSLDLVGNPIHLLSSLSTGVVDFFYEPVIALYNSPTEISKIGKGVMKGAVSLASHTADGLIGTATTMTRSVGKGVAALTMDDVFLRNREKLNKNPESVSGHLIRPIKDIGNGIYCGVVGIARVPYAGAKRNGAVGFVVGVAKGIAGVAAKPVVGVLDAITHTGEGVRYGMKCLKHKGGRPARKRRHSNVFGPDGRLMPYSYTTAYGANMLRLLDHEYWERSTAATRQRFIPRADSSRRRNNAESTNNPRSYMEKSKGTSIIASQIKNAGGKKKSSLRIMTKYTAAEDNDYDDDADADEKGMSEVSQFTLMRARRQSMSMTGSYSSELHQLEAVIYTAVINRGTGFDQLVVVTTLRVVVGEYRRDKSGTSVVVNWQSKLRTLKKPVLERSGGGTVTLLLVGLGQRPAMRRQGSSSDSSISVSGDYEVLRQLYNCLNTLLHNFDILIPMYEGDDTWEEDENNIIRIGQWQYVRPNVQGDDDDDDEDNNSKIAHRKVMSALGECDWIVKDFSFGMKSTPSWLMTDRLQAVNSHSQVSEYKIKGAVRIRDNGNESMFKELLRHGRVTGEEFDVLMATEAKGHELNHPQPTIEVDTTRREAPSAFPTILAKKIRKSVRRTISRFTTSSDDDQTGIPASPTQHRPNFEHAKSASQFIKPSEHRHAELLSTYRVDATRGLKSFESIQEHDPSGDGEREIQPLRARMRSVSDTALPARVTVETGIDDADDALSVLERGDSDDNKSDGDPLTFDSSPMASTFNHKRMTAPVLRSTRSAPGTNVSPREVPSSPLFSRRPFAAMSRLFDSTDSHTLDEVSMSSNTGIVDATVKSPEKVGNTVGDSSGVDSPQSGDTKDESANSSPLSRLPLFPTTISTSGKESLSPLASVIESDREEQEALDSSESDSDSEKSGSITVIKSDKKASPRVNGTNTPTGAVFTSPARPADQTSTSNGGGKHLYAALSGKDDDSVEDDKEDTPLTHRLSENDLISAMTAESENKSEVMDRLSRMEELLTTMIAKSSLSSKAKAEILGNEQDTKNKAMSPSPGGFVTPKLHGSKK